MKHCLMSMLCMVWLVLPALAQKNYDVSFKSGTVHASKFYPPPKSQQIINDLHSFGGQYYLVLQFEDIPSIEEREVLQAQNIELLYYLPNYAYLASVPVGTNITELEVSAILPIQPENKMSRDLANGDYPDHALTGDYVSLSVLPYPDISTWSLLHHLWQHGFSAVLNRMEQISVHLPVSRVAELAALTPVMYLEAKEPNPVKEGQGGRNLHRINHLGGGGSESYTGAGVFMAIADDGAVFHLDFLGRIIDHTQNDAGNHGEMTVGLAIGAGNIDPQGIGMAPGAKLHLYDISNYPHINDAPSNYFQYGTVITSTSYGEGCGGVYSYSAQSLDEQVVETHELLHVFSAGNSSGVSCGIYGQVGPIDGQYYGNITGGRKAAKHSMAVGNLFYNDELRSTSSRGPAEDGRIKPDICSFGQGNWTTDTGNGYRSGGGTSAASPVVAGTAALLYEAFREFHNGMTPASALIKATMLNTAEDLGRPGPDYDFGWGRLHGKRAIETIENQWHYHSSINHGEQNVHLLTLPSGVKELRAMVYWLDPAGSPQAEKALVNDLDFTMRDPASQNHLPWVLSTATHADSLVKPAYPGVDRVNNMEQIRVLNPTAGTYELKVIGHLVPMGAQEYYIVYHYTTEALTLTHPVGGEGFVPGTIEALHWDAIGTNGAFTLEYSTNGMQSWQLISNNVGGDKRLYDWLVPPTITGDVRIRIRRGAASDTSNEPFCIIQTPQIAFGFVNNSSARVYWPPVPGAVSYDVHALGQEYMELISNTQDTSFAFNIGTWEERWMAVSAKMATGVSGRRCIAQKYVHVPCENQIQVQLHFDTYPAETSWAILGPDGEVVKSGGLYHFQAAGSTLILEECLPAGCYDFVIYDSYGDGMCCQAGEGSYQLVDQAGQVLAAGGTFTVAELTAFCVEETTPNLNISIINTTNVSCAGEEDGSATILASGGTGAYTYIWEHGATGNHLNNLSAGNYSVTVTDGQATATTTVSISQPTPIAIDLNSSNATCGGDGTGAIFTEVTGGTTPYSYAWSNGASSTSVEDLEAGAYSLTITDAQGCSHSETTFIESTSGPEITVYSSNASCAQTSNGWAFAYATNGIGNYSYSWSNGVESPLNNGLLPGNYTITVIDGNGCETVETVAIESPSGIMVTPIVNHETCANAEDGIITLDISGGVGPYAVSWNTGQQGEQIEGLSSGAYLYNINDGNGCTTFGQVSVDSPAPIYLALANTEATDGNNGSINLTVIGGAPPYTYSWSNGEQIEDISNLAPGLYSVTVTDNHGCESYTSATVEDQDTGYCLSRGSNTNFEWIESIQIGETTLTSGNNNGYLNHQNNPIILAPDAIVPVYLEPGYASTTYNEYWKLWLDWNQDGDFDDTGEALLAPPASNATIAANIIIPAGALTGLTRMRVAMKYGSVPGSCGTYAYGEVEDIVINIGEDAGNLGNSNDLLGLQGGELAATATSSSKVDVFPNPATNNLTVAFDATAEEATTLELWSVKGHLQHRETRNVTKGYNGWELDISHIPAGHYFLKLKGGSILQVESVVILGL